MNMLIPISYKLCLLHLWYKSPPTIAVQLDPDYTPSKPGARPVAKTRMLNSRQLSEYSRTATAVTKPGD